MTQAGLSIRAERACLLSWACQNACEWGQLCYFSMEKRNKPSGQYQSPYNVSFSGLVTLRTANQTSSHNMERWQKTVPLTRTNHYWPLSPLLYKICSAFKNLHYLLSSVEHKRILEKKKTFEQKMKVDGDQGSSRYKKAQKQVIFVALKTKIHVDIFWYSCLTSLATIHFQWKRAAWTFCFKKLDFCVSHRGVMAHVFVFTFSYIFVPKE